MDMETLAKEFVFGFEQNYGGEYDETTYTYE